jgi:hypothetical protein
MNLHGIECDLQGGVGAEDLGCTAVETGYRLSIILARKRPPINIRTKTSLTYKT